MKNLKWIWLWIIWTWRNRKDFGTIYGEGKDVVEVCKEASKDKKVTKKELQGILKEIGEFVESWILILD